MAANSVTPAEYRQLLTSRAPRGKKIYALGRLKSGEMNKTEKSYSDHLASRQLAGEIAWFKFEAIKLRLADRTFFEADFFVMLADGTLEVHECKGGPIEDDAAVKTKCAAEIFPFRFFIVRAIPKRDGGGFSLKDVANGL
jgi:hypothetical protein